MRLSEDCFYLVDGLPVFDPARPPIRTDDLTPIFKAYAEKQQPHTSTLVKAARKVGEIRVTDPELCDERDRLVANKIADRAGIDAHYDFQFTRPF